jgi:ubiquinone/menaquinone biosynthesis C-methylase UbiE
LDAGAGTGVIANRVASLCDEVFALEPLEKRVKFIQRRFPEVKAFQGFAENIPFPEAYFTKIYSVSALHHFLDQARALSEFNRILKNGGTLLIQDSNPEKLGSKVETKVAAVRFISHSDLAEMLKSAGFVLKDSRNLPRSYLLLAAKQETAN